VIEQNKFFKYYNFGQLAFAKKLIPLLWILLNEILSHIKRTQSDDANILTPLSSI
jgi:hypothetical protein